MSICPSNPVPKPTCEKCPQEGQCQCGVDLDTGGPEVQRSYLSSLVGDFKLRWFNRLCQSGTLDNPDQGLGTNWLSPTFGHLSVDSDDGTVMVVYSPQHGDRTVYFSKTGPDTYSAS